MKFDFYKYHGTGNDFVLVDNRKKKYNFTEEEIKLLCNRRFGIGADGFMSLEKHANYDFEMKYYNSDGRIGTMCGNGGRCIVAFAKQLNIIERNTKFLAADGEHEAECLSNEEVKLKMKNVDSIETGDSYYFLDTGSPHYIKFVYHLDELDVYEEGKKIRYNDRFAEKGTNVNFVEIYPDLLYVRTYERGVEDETLSCGTGITASALAAATISNKKLSSIDIKARGGNLKVHFIKSGNKFEDIWLQGPTKFVFKGKIKL